MWKKFVQDYLTFSKKERFAILLLVGIFAVITILPYLLPSAPDETITEDNKQLLQEFKKLSELPPQAVDEDALPENQNFASAVSERSAKLFYFDPNLISVDEWKQLGVKEKTALTIRKYLSKGGKFRKPDDLLKIYTIDREVAKKLMPYIRIGLETEEARKIPKENPDKDRDIESHNESFKKKSYREVDINISDTTAFKALPGIGSKLSERIVRYRESLGGFVSIDQIGEVRFLPDTTFQKIRPFLKLGSPEIHKININSINLEELTRHPYFNYTVAHSIVEYRQQHGPFKDISSLRSIHVITEEHFKKISPYLSIK